MSTITPLYRSVQDLLQSHSFSIDEYQREYKWERKHIDELLSDLLEKFLSCYQSGHDTKKVSSYEDYFLGSIIVSKRNGKNFLIDGQQRVTSLTLLLIYLYRAAEGRSHPIVKSMAPLIYSDNLGEPEFNLDIPERRPVIKALFEGEDFVPDGKEESIQNMYSRYCDIEEKDLAGELGEALPHFIYWLMKKVGLIEIATDNDNYAYSIFETMNDRGKPLSPVDMLKAYLLAPITDDNQRKIANQTWKQNVLKLISWGGEHEPERDAACIKAWLRAKFAESIRERKANTADRDWELAGSTFHRWVRDNHERLQLGSEAKNLDLIRNQLPFYANAYLTVLQASRNYTPGLESVFYNGTNEFTWQNTVLLAPLRESDDEKTVKTKISITATYIDIWLMRRVVNYIRVGYSSTSYAMYKLCGDIREKPVDDLVAILTKRLAEDDVSFDGVPEKGRDGITGLRINQFSKWYILHLLARLTSFVEVQSGKPDLFPSYIDRNVKNPFDIEHICADSFERFGGEFSDRQEFQDWRNNVAGLLLLPADVNRSYQDKSFKEKAPHYAKQNLLAASLTASCYQHQPQFLNFKERNRLSFKAYDVFGKNEQQERKKLICELVKLVWSPERLSSVARSPAK